MALLSFTKKYGLLAVGLFMLLLLVVVSLFGQYFPFVDKELEEIDYLWFGEIPRIPPFEPSEMFLLGTDIYGRDLLSLIIIGAKETLLIVIGITIVRYLFALPIGYLAHKRRFGFDHLLNLLNQFLSYIPSIVVVILFVTLPPILFSDFRPHYFVIIIALAEVGRVSDMLKVEFDQLSQKEFIAGGVAVGVSPLRLLSKYYFPFIYNKLLVAIVTDMGKVMFLLGQLGFLSIFVSQELVQVEIGQFEIFNTSISWPMLLMDAVRDIRGPVWVPFYASLAMTYVILTFNILAQGLQKFLHRKTNYI